MMKSVLSATVLSLLVSSAAWAWPTILPNSHLTATDVVQVKSSKNYNHKNSSHNYNKHSYNHAYNKHDRYHYGNRYYAHRYHYRPNNWQALGCVAIGPIWYCQ
jgi:hypothetical protein